MNSSLAKPTPELGKNEFKKATSGWLVLIIIFVLVFGIFFKLHFLISNFSWPSKPLPVWPKEQSIVTILPVFKTLVALSAPTIQGIPSSRETMAAWHVLPPCSVTIALACFIMLVQSGSVISVTRTSPGLKFLIWLMLGTSLAFPEVILEPIASPST